MSQTNPKINWNTPGSVALPRLDEVLSAMRSGWSGPVPPADPQHGQFWTDTSPTGHYILKQRYNSAWVPVYSVYSESDVRLISQTDADGIVAGTANKYPDAAAVKTYAEENLAGKDVAAVGAAGLVEKATAEDLAAGNADKYPDAAVVKAFVERSSGGLIGAPVIFRESGRYVKSPLARLLLIKMYGAGGRGGNSFYSPAYSTGRDRTVRTIPAEYSRGGDGSNGEYAEKYMVAANIPAFVSVSFDQINNQVSFGEGAALIFSVKSGNNGGNAANRRNGSSGTKAGTGFDVSNTTPALRSRSNGLGFSGSGGAGSSTSADGADGDTGLVLIYEYR